VISVDTVGDLRRQLARWREMGERIALVPTMGNLHPGHLRLVERGRDLADRMVVSIFVNPLQFGETEDLDAYPRTMTEDETKLVSAGVDLLFAPALSEVYSRPRTEQTLVQVPVISDILCGASRPGHFTGVATVVCKLFNMVQPDLALFGEKDFQQLLVIRRMAEDLCMPIEIRSVPTVREEDGLALSSRNGYLTPGERELAPAIYRQLNITATAIQSGDTDYLRLEEQAVNALEEEGLRPEYFQIRRALDLAEPTVNDRQLVILAAAFLGRARLIDNLSLTLD